MSDEPRQGRIVRRFGWKLAGAMTLAGVLLGAAGWHFMAYDRFYTDHATIRQVASEARPRDILWQPPEPLREILQLGADDYEPRLSWDGLTLFFVRGKAGANADIWHARRTPTGWSAPEPLDVLNTPGDELGPSPSADGTALYFYSDRESGFGGYDLWLARRSGDDWLEPANLGPTVNTPFNEYGPAPANDGTTLYFASNRPQPGDLRGPTPGAWPATVREDLFRRTYDLYRAHLGPSGAADRVEPLSALNTPHNEGAPAVSPAGDFVYFASDRPGGEGGYDLFRARLRGEAFDPVRGLGKPVNTPANELDPALASLGFGLFFSSDRPAMTLATPSAASQPAPIAEDGGLPRYALYYSSAREVELQTGASEVDWAALWRAIWPSLLWALLALLLLLLLLALLADARRGRLSLLARCLLASLMAHLLLLFLMSFWRVSNEVIRVLRRPGEVKVAMISGGVTDVLTHQIRGDITQPDVVAPTEPQLITAAAPEVSIADRPVDVDVAPVALSMPQPAPLDVATAAPERASEVSPPQAADAPVEPQRVALDVASPAAPRPLAGAPEQIASPTAVPAQALPQAAMSADVTPLDERSAFFSVDAPTAAAPEAPRSLAAENMPDVQQRPDAVVDAYLPASDTHQAATPVRPLDLATPRTSVPAAAGEEAAPLRVSAARLEPTAAPTAAREVLRAAASQPATVTDLAKLPPAPQERASLAQGFAPATERSASSPAAAEASAADRPAMAALPAAALAVELPRGEALAQAAEPAEATPVAAAGPTRVARAPQVGTLATAPPQRTVVEVAPPPSVPSDAIRASAPDASLFADHAAPRSADAESRPPPPVEAVLPSLVAASPAPSPFTLELATPRETEPPSQPGPARLIGRDGAALAADAGIVGEPVGVITGRITDASSGEPLTGATIRLDIPGGNAIVAESDERGAYQLPVPQMPDNFVITADHPRYEPEAANIPSSELEGGRLRHDFGLRPDRRDVLVLEATPEVHHIGNDRFEGSINSQFQRESEGRGIAYLFTLHPDRWRALGEVAVVRLMCKGVQCPPVVRVNGRRIEHEIEESPRDGSFGEFRVPFPAGLLNEGENSFSIQTTSCMGDLDDQEWMLIHLDLDAESED